MRGFDTKESTVPSFSPTTRASDGGVRALVKLTGVGCISWLGCDRDEMDVDDGYALVWAKARGAPVVGVGYGGF